MSSIAALHLGVTTAIVGRWGRHLLTQWASSQDFSDEIGETIGHAILIALGLWIISHL